MRTKEEWATVRDRFGEWADFLDPMISGKRGQDDRWAYAAYLNICDLGVSCSPRFLEMADETWGVVVDWGGTWYQITTERERIAFLSAAKREIQRQARLRERERSQNDFLQWQIEQARKEEARKSRSYNAQ